MKDFDRNELHNSHFGVLRNTTLQSLLAGFSIEITTKEAVKIADFTKLLPDNTEVYIVATPNTSPEEVISLAARLYQQGMIPVPHIAARAVINVGVLDRWLRTLYVTANVNRALIVAGGNNDKPVGPFSSSIELMNSGILANNGIHDVRFAGHPEGHSLLSDARLIEILLEKQKAGKKQCYKTSLVTQFFFDFEAVAQWERKLVRLDINMPIRVGFHGVVGLSCLIRHAMFCGVGASLNQLMKNPARFVNAAALASPEKLLLGLAGHCQSYPQSLFTSCHFFPLGSFERTAEWLRFLSK